MILLYLGYIWIIIILLYGYKQDGLKFSICTAAVPELVEQGTAGWKENVIE